MGETIRVIVADDHPLIRTGVQIVLAETSDIQVVGEAGNGAETIEVAHHTPADVILLDVSMPGMPATTVVEILRRIAPTLKIIIVTASDDETVAQALINAGAVGYLLKEEAEAYLVHMIRVVHGGETWYSPGVQESLSGTASHPPPNPAPEPPSRTAPSLCTTPHRSIRMPLEIVTALTHSI